jgi:hypothetical protein
MQPYFDRVAKKVRTMHPVCRFIIYRCIYFLDELEKLVEIPPLPPLDLSEEKSLERAEEILKYGDVKTHCTGIRRVHWCEYLDQ